MAAAKSPPMTSIPTDLPALRAAAQWACADRPNVLSPDEVDRISDSEALNAWRRFDPARGASFYTFARYSVRGAVRRALRLRLRQWVVAASDDPVYDTIARPCGADDVALAHEVAAQLSPLELELALRAGDGESLAEIARSLGRHPSWASRKMRALRARFAARERPGLSASRRAGRERRATGGRAD